MTVAAAWPATGGVANVSSSAASDGLVVGDLRVTYANGAVGVDGASVAVRPHDVVAVLGRNGAGKTSLLSGIAGFLKSERVTVTGSVRVAGTELCGSNPMRTNRHGVVLVPERNKVFPSLTVTENLALATGRRATDAFDLATRFPALERRARSRAGMLSGGERQMLALAMAVAQQPRVLLVDELSLGLAPVVVKQLMSSLREISDALDVSILLIEQDASAAMKAADYLYVLDRGRIVWKGDTGAISAAELGHRYLGLPT